MSCRGSVKERQAFREYTKAQVLDVFLKHPGELLTSIQISKTLEERGVNVSPYTVKKHVRELVKEYSELTSVPRMGYIYAEDISEFYAEKTTRKKNTVMRNSEGYSDPTAGTAIKNIEGDDPYARLGEIWSVNGSNGQIEWFMILSDWGTVRIGIPLYTGDFRSRIRVKVDLEGIVLYGDTTNLRSKPSKYFDTYVGSVGDKKAKAILDDALKAVCDPDISPTVIEKVNPANTITVDGKLYTEADVKSKIDSVEILKSQNAAYDDEVIKLSEELESKKTVILDQESQISDLTRMNRDLSDANNGLRTLITEKKNTPIILQVDGEVYNEEDIKTIIRARNTVRVGDKVYKASDICELLEKKDKSAPVPDKAYIDKVIAMATIYKQFFDAYCQGMAKGVVE